MLPLPVGDYGLWPDDDIFPDTSLPAHVAHSPMQKSMTKYRQFGHMGSFRHWLENQHNLRLTLAMITSGYYIKELWSHTSAEAVIMTRLVNDLLVKAGVYAFWCFRQHHALVFYADAQNNGLLTPEAFAELLSDGKRGKQILKVMKQHSKHKKKIDAGHKRTSICLQTNSKALKI